MQFAGAKLKVQRAKKHIRELQSLLDSWIDTNPYQVSVNEDAKTGLNYVSLEVTQTIPDDIALVIGDVIHNFRSVLDFIAYEIVTAAGGSGNRVYFPFEGDRDSLKASSKYTTIKSVSKKAASLILDTIKPYKTGNYTLWALNKIDNIDKHRLLIPSIQVVSITVDAVDDNQNQFINNTISLGGAGKINAFRSASKFHITRYGKPYFNIFFGPGTFFDAEPIPETFMKIGREVSKVIALFEKARLGMKPKPIGLGFSRP